MKRSDYILEAKNITKVFNNTKVLNSVNLSVKRGEVHALLGENGAGKSTLMKIIMGEHKPDGKSEIFFNNQKVDIKNPSEALKTGISMIYQELSSISDMTIEENIFLGREILHKGLPFIDKKNLFMKTQKLLSMFDLNLNPNTKTRQLSVAQKQMIEIIKAVSYEANLIIMDEPTSSLSDKEVEKLFEAINNIRKRGVSVIYISHKLEELFEIADRVTVLRDGSYIGTEETKNVSKEKLIEMMVGRKLENLFPKKKAEIGSIYFEVRNYNKMNIFKNINFHVKKGEILGFAGLIGAGRTELARAIFGLDEVDDGVLILDGKEIKIDSSKDAIDKGIYMLSEDRKELGLVLCRSIKENISLPHFDKTFIDFKSENTKCVDVTKRTNVKMNNLDQKVKYLSGGNQQKVVLSKWLIKKPKVLILDEPTRGIDIGAKAEIYNIISDLANEGISIILISSELPELIALSDRILVMSEGEITKELKRNSFENEAFSQESILKHAIGGGPN
ncbi:ATP-binding cassette domain-containing protein [Iocasia frigidifontis]|uniref:ATP-binding cassette domain-containing protein n=1 Tax=Iocasia fonsfrigidae TaxID=2682810 RepID=A0A8A7K8E4_9FIRM|nr:sugar ABC transporter ATP-binding protein [Iocasia fonsfrigidae]QTL97731.1 ATP-binding cassette domain-containing protein [Iocasia fonsfrigidae]